MLIFEYEGFFEIEEENIEQVYRSTHQVDLSAGPEEIFTIQAMLCKHQRDDESFCHAAFYCNLLKRAQIFTVKGGKVDEQWAHGLESLNGLGLEMEPVNLSVSPAMRQVILKDVPGLMSVQEAARHRDDESARLAELEETIREKPGSAAAKKATLKLESEQRLSERAAILKDTLIAYFSPDMDSASEEVEALASQVESLTGRLQDAEQALEEERASRNMAEGIQAAAEKRIQELEEVLVDVDTKTSDTVKQKQKIVDLNGRIKQLTTELEAARNDVEAERAKQEPFVEDIKAAHEQIKALEKERAELEEVATSSIELEEQARLDAEKVKSLSADLDLFKDQVEKLTAENERLETEQKNAGASQEEMGREQEALKDALAALEQDRAKLEKELASVQEELLKLQSLQEHQEEQAHEESAEFTELQEQVLTLKKQQQDAEEDLQQERSIRRRLEKGAVEDEKRIQELEQLLAEQGGDEEPVKPNYGSAREVERLNSKLQDARNEYARELTFRKELETELDEAHTLIGDLEKALKASGTGTPGQGSTKEDTAHIDALTAQIESLTTQLEQERAGHEELTVQYAEAESRIEDLKDQIKTGLRTFENKKAPEETATRPKLAKVDWSEKPLPHETRPKPKKGAVFHPDWDLERLPATSADQVLQAWKSIYNVQLSLEGYPSQYAASFLCVLKIGKVKKVFLLFNLKKNKHILVCVPAKTPKSDNDVKKAVAAATKYMEMSGFEMEKVGKDEVDRTLGSYFS